jgi:diguanylate cyclase (GGDEF)-like protein
MKILIAEDDPVSSRLLESVLARWGYEVITTSDGEEALEALNSEDPPRIAILDWMMPRIDGIEVCRRIREQEEHNYTYMILLTAKNQKEDIIKGLASGADDYITKPFDSHELELRLKAGKRVIELEDKLKHQAFHDRLTDLPNREQFINSLCRVNQRSKFVENGMFAVLFLDLDRFKIINESLGHVRGDELLVAVAERIATSTRPNDIVARFGGDEFAVLLNNIKDRKDATLVASRLQQDFSMPFNLSGHEVTTTASIGIAMSETNYESEEDILRDADLAMYRAKAGGKARYEIFDTRMHSEAMNLLQLEADLRQAINRDELSVNYQPIVSLGDKRVNGIEALLRWHHPERGFVSPMEFIPLAEETGLISSLGEWILRKACAQNRIWHDAGYGHLCIGVNFSSRQFQHQDIPGLVKSVLAETGMPAHSLNIEITESIAMEPHSIKILNELTDMGVKTSIDDFGTGYSSLGSLKQFPIDTIKIDRSFVKEVSLDANVATIVKAIIAMAHSLNMKVVAEGVEFLQLNNCDELQGYLFSPPVPENEFMTLLEKGMHGIPGAPAKKEHSLIT